MNYSPVTSNKIPDKVRCPTSKSYANRALIIAALRQESITLYDVPGAQDVEDLLQMFAQIGLQVTRDKGRIIVENSFPACELKKEMPVELSGSEGGTTIRFLLPLLALGQNNYIVPLKGKLASRPMTAFLDNLNVWGATVSMTGDRVFIKGAMTPKDIEIDCSQTTQFASALMLLNSRYNFKIITKNLNTSLQYLEMTKFVLSKLTTNKSMAIPYDASSLGYLLSYAVLKQNLHIDNVQSIDLCQADTKIFDILNMIGATYSFSEDGLRIFKMSCLSDLKGFEIDGSTCIDLVPTLVYLASFLKKDCHIYKIQNLQYKESNRLEGVKFLLEQFQLRYNYDQVSDHLTLFGEESPISPFKLATEIDHRMVMVAVLFLKTLGGGEVAHTRCITKSFPSFYGLFK